MDSDTFSTNALDINGSFSLVICAILILGSIILIVVYCSGEKRNAISNVSNTPVFFEDDDQQQLRCEWIPSKKESTSIGLKVIIPKSLVSKYIGRGAVFTFDFIVVQEQIPGVQVLVWNGQFTNRKCDHNGLFILYFQKTSCLAIMSDPQFTLALSIGIGPKVYHISPLPPITLSD
jgi:hypothetical protein